MIQEVHNFWNTWYDWLRSETDGYYAAVEFGAGFFDKLSTLNCTVKIGIEKYEPYVTNARFSKCTQIVGDMMEYRKLLRVRLERKDLRPAVAIFIDTLEHLEKEDAVKLIGLVKEDFDKIVMMVPNGNIHQDKDVTGFDNHEGQTHRSKWFEEDLAELGMETILVDNDFHKDFSDKRSYFATWTKR